MSANTPDKRLRTATALIAMRLHSAARDDWDDETIAAVAAEVAEDVAKTLNPFERPSGVDVEPESP